MNSAHVYKRHSFISNECVRIPDEDIKHDAIEPLSGPRSEEEMSFSVESEATEVNSDAARIAEPVNSDDCLNGTVSDDAGHETELKKQGKRADLNSPVEIKSNPDQVPDKEALSLIYKKELDELSRAAAQAAAQSAYFDALNKKKCELKECISDVQTLLNELTHKHEEFIEQYTNELKYMAVNIAEKMILEKISDDDEILQKLVLQNVKSVKNADWIGVELSERLVGLVDYIKKELEMPEYKGKANVNMVADKIDTVRITTEDGTLVSTISVQANNLRKAFKEADL